MARRVGTRVRHLKLHGALSNTASEDTGIARTCYPAALAVDPDIVLMIFADRPFNDDGTLVGRESVPQEYPGRLQTDRR